MNEFQLINFLTKGLKEYGFRILENIGDDTAVVKYPNDKCVLLTTDSLVEGIHFKLDYNIPQKRLWFYLGWKALAVNISDIFAMGGTPADALISLHIPQKIKSSSLKTLYTGMKACADKYKVNIIGGNTSSSRYDFIISVTLTGVAKTRNILLRKNAGTGDYIYVQNGIGLAKAGLELLKQRCVQPRSLVLAHLQPVPFIDWKKLQTKYTINSAIDISDGLVGDLGHILADSNKGAEIYLQQLPVNNDLKMTFPGNYLKFILSGGEDYKILFTSPDKITENNIFSIGKINSKKGLVLIGSNKITRINDPAGYRHKVGQ